MTRRSNPFPSVTGRRAMKPRSAGHTHVKRFPMTTTLLLIDIQNEALLNFEWVKRHAG